MNENIDKVGPAILSPLLRVPKHPILLARFGAAEIDLAARGGAGDDQITVAAAVAAVRDGGFGPRLAVRINGLDTDWGWTIWRR